MYLVDYMVYTGGVFGMIPLKVIGTMFMPLILTVALVTCYMVNSIGIYFQKCDCSLKI